MKKFNGYRRGAAPTCPDRGSARTYGSIQANSWTVQKILAADFSDYHTIAKIFNLDGGFNGNELARSCAIHENLTVLSGDLGNNDPFTHLPFASF